MTLQDTLRNFFEEVQHYQSNHYGNYDKRLLVKAYSLLPENVRLYLEPKREILSRLWRGCDGISEQSVISFTTNKGLAHLFGVYVIPFSELRAYGRLISTEQSYKLSQKLFKNEFSIGDDEGEVLVILPSWKPTLDLEKYRNDL